MKTAVLLLLLWVVGLALVCAELHGEDQYTEDANVVAVDDSAAAMDEADEMDDSRRSQEHRRRDTARWHSFKRSAKAQFDFDGLLEANVIVSQTHWEQNTNTARWSAKFNEFDDDICPGGELNWHVHEYPVSETASNIRTMNTQIKSFNTQTTQIESFNKQTAQIVYFAPNGVNGVTGAVTASTTSAGELKLDWDLAGLEASTTASGSNGIHIHYGTSCDSEATVQGDAPTDTNQSADPALNANKGHYYNPATSYLNSDPWANVKYISDVAGKSTGSVTIPGSSTSEVSLGADDFSAFSRVVIVHNVDGTKRGCGVLAPSNTVKGTVDAYIKPPQVGRACADYKASGSHGSHYTYKSCEEKLKVEWHLAGLEENISGQIEMTQIKSFNTQTAQIVYFEPNGQNDVMGTATASTTSAGELKLDWDLAGLEASTTASGSNGIHIHYGKSCDSEATVQGDAPVVPGTTTAAKPAGTPSANKGHYYVPTDPDVLVASEDPWANVKYISDVAGKSTGSVTIPGSSLGAAHFSAFSRVVIVHDPTTGAKIGCGVLAPSNAVMGTATASTTSAGELKLDWDLAGLTPDTPSTGPGKNGIHIHYGRSCDSETTIKGVFYDPASQFNPTTHDPWSPVKWASDANGRAVGSEVFSRFQLGEFVEQAFGRVVIVHNAAGTKIGCGVLAPSNFDALGIDRRKNGIHIHYGTSCDSETTVKGDAPPWTNGRYHSPTNQGNQRDGGWSPIKPDWLANVHYPTIWVSGADGTSTGSVELTARQLGVPVDSAFSRVVIVHNTAGTKIGCGVLAPSNRNLVTGTVTASTTSDGELKLEWDLAGLPADDEAPPAASTDTSAPTAACQCTDQADWITTAGDNCYTMYTSAADCEKYGENADANGVLPASACCICGGGTCATKNGIHIHYGTSCDSEATVRGDAPDGASTGHYYNPWSYDYGASKDPWVDVKWASDAAGKSTNSVTISADDLGASPDTAYNRVVIVHNAAGTKIGCGVLSSNAPGCSKGVTGGHYDPTFACGGASQNNANGVCSNLRATDQAPAGNGLVKGAYKCTPDNQSQCEIGDQSGKMGKIHAMRTLSDGQTRVNLAYQKFSDMWMENISNLKGRSLVLHCCTEADGCSERIACANLE